MCIFKKMKFILKFLSNWFIQCICIYYCSQWSCTPRIIDWSSKTITSKFLFCIIYKLSHTKNKSQEIKIKIETMPFYDSNNERLKLQFIQVLNLLFLHYIMNKNLGFVTNGWPTWSTSWQKRISNIVYPLKK